jgi:uncharacterized protein YjbI with pentapeptide repeats
MPTNPPTESTIPMTDDSDIQHLKKQMDQYTSNLRHFENQAAKFGGESNVPIYLMNDLHETRQMLDQLTMQLGKLGVTVAPVASTFQLPSSMEHYNPEQTLRECQEYILDNLETLIDNPSRSLLSRAKHRVHTTFRMLDSERKGILLQFLYDEQLIGYESSGEVQNAILSLESADLRGINANGRYLNGCDLTRAHCHIGQFNGTSMKNATLRNTLCKGASFSEANLIKSFLANSNFSKSDFQNANLSDANLSDANLSDANLSDANLSDANLSDANLRKANLVDAKMTDSNLANANLSDANLSDAQLTRSDLSGAELSFANLTGIIAIGTSFNRASLSGVNFSRAILIGASFVSSRIYSAKFNNAYLDGATFISSDINEVDFLDSNLTHDQLKEASSYQEVILPFHLPD